MPKYNSNIKNKIKKKVNETSTNIYNQKGDNQKIENSSYTSKDQKLISYSQRSKIKLKITYTHSPKIKFKKLT